MDVKGEGGSGGESELRVIQICFVNVLLIFNVTCSFQILAFLQAIRIMFTPLNIGAYDLENCFSIFSSVASFIHQIHTFSLDPLSDQYYEEK